MEFKNLLKLVNAVSESELTGFYYEEDGVKLKLKKEKGNVQVVSTPTASKVSDEMAVSAESVMVSPEKEAYDAAENVPELSGKVVVSPLVGTFYSAPAEDAEIFVKVGDRVEKGQTLGIVEAMKLMNEIESDYSGTVAEILVNNQEGVEYGQPLFRIV